MAVVLTVGLSLISRTTTDIKISRQQEESARAFSAAEAGIEELLKTGSAGVPIQSTLESGAQFFANVPTATGQTEYTFPEEIAPGESATLWLATHDAGGSLTAPYYPASAAFNLCWSSGAVEVSVYYQQGSEHKVARAAFDAVPGRGNNFASPDGGSCLGFANKKMVKFADLGVPGGATLLFVNLKPYYGAAKIGVEAQAGSVFSAQGREIVSTGTLGQITRKVKVVQGWPAPPAVFDYPLFSGGDLAK
jgi:hypothetical protein